VSVHRLGAAVLLALLAHDPSPAAAAPVFADSADDVCSPTADPCVVSEPVDVVINSTLDFGLRDVVLESQGRFETEGPGRITVRCGSLTANVAGNAFVLRPSPGKLAYSPDLVLEARKQCNAGSRPCLDTDDCQLGACSARRCTQKSTLLCQADTDCELGTCIAPGQPNARRCSGRTSVRCDTNADCGGGSCPEQLTCQGSAAAPVACATNADCHFGSCANGSGTIDIAGGIHGWGTDGTNLLFDAAGDIRLRGAVQIAVDPATGNGGLVRLTAPLGSVSILAPLHAEGYYGGLLNVKAGIDAELSGPIVLNGDDEGGSVEIASGRDIVVGDDIIANGAINGASGGLMTLAAGRDVRVTGGGDSNRTLISVDGADPDDGSSDGEAGEVEIVAGHEIALETFGRITGHGGQPGGGGGYVTLEATDSIVVAGSIIVSSNGMLGYPGKIFLESEGDITVTQTGVLNSSSTLHAPAGEIGVTAAGTASIDGSLLNGGAQGVDINVSACSVIVGPDGRLLHKAEQGDNNIRAGTSLVVHAGGSIKSGHGSNTLRMGPHASPPTIEGLVNPAFVEGVFAAPVCPLLCGDASEPCDDGVDCTFESCDGDVCVSTPDDQVCDDGVFCNGEEHCSLQGCQSGQLPDCSHRNTDCQTGACSQEQDHCIAVAVDDLTPCDDGDACTLSDHCLGGTCAGSPDDDCFGCGNAVVDEGEDCDDGDDAFASGDACAADCHAVPCGFPFGAGQTSPTAAAALYVLKAALGLVPCALSVCDTNGSGSLSAADALVLLWYVVGRDVALQCPV